MNSFNWFNTFMKFMNSDKVYNPSNDKANTPNTLIQNKRFKVNDSENEYFNVNYI